MRTNLPRTVSIAALYVGTLGLLSALLMHLHRPSPSLPVKDPKSVIAEKKPRGLLKEALMPRQSEIEDCYESFLRGHPPVAEGAVSVKWLVNPQGAVLSTEITQSELNNEKLQLCLMEKLQGIHFAPPPGQRETWIGYKFHFRRRAQASLSFSDE